MYTPLMIVHIVHVSDLSIKSHRTHVYYDMQYRNIHIYPQTTYLLTYLLEGSGAT